MISFFIPPTSFGVIYLYSSRDKPYPLRLFGRGVGARLRLQHRVQEGRVRSLLSSRVWEDTFYKRTIYLNLS